MKKNPVTPINVVVNAISRVERANLKENTKNDELVCQDYVLRSFLVRTTYNVIKDTITCYNLILTGSRFGACVLFLFFQDRVSGH